MKTLLISPARNACAQSGIVGVRTSIISGKSIILSIILFLSLFVQIMFAQGVVIGESAGLTADGNAILDLRSASATRGFLVPQLAAWSGGTPDAGAKGLMYFNTGTNSFNFWNSTTWVVLATTGNLSQFAATTSAQLAGIISDETGSGSLVFATSPTLVTPILGTPTSGNLTNCTFPTLNQNTTGTANIAGGTLGAIPYQSAANTTTILAATTTAGQVLRSGASAAPSWITTTYPNAATTGDVIIATGTNIIGNLADVTAGSYLRSGGAATVPVWSTLTLPNAATQGDLLYASGTNAIGNLTDVAVGRVLISGGVGANPAYSATPTLGVAGTTLGTLSLSGNTSGTILIQPQAAAGSYNFNLPITAGASGQALVSGGGGATAMSFSSIPGVASITANAAATNAATVLTGATWTMPANSANVGPVIRIRCNFNFVHTGAVTPTLTCNLTVAGASVAAFIITPIATAATYRGIY